MVNCFTLKASVVNVVNSDTAILTTILCGTPCMHGDGAHSEFFVTHKFLLTVRIIFPFDANGKPIISPIHYYLKDVTTGITISSGTLSEPPRMLEIDYDVFVPLHNLEFCVWLNVYNLFTECELQLFEYTEFSHLIGPDANSINGGCWQIT